MKESLSPGAQRLLEARAIRLAAPAHEAASEETVGLATFAVGDLEVGLPLDALRAALPLRRVTPVPLAPPEVIGVLRFSGAVLPVYSLAFMLGGQPSRRDSTHLLVVERGAGRLVAFDCVQVPLATTRPAREIELARARTREGEPLTDVMLGDRVLTLVDVGRLCAVWEKKRGA